MSWYVLGGRHVLLHRMARSWCFMLHMHMAEPYFAGDSYDSWDFQLEIFRFSGNLWNASCCRRLVLHHAWNHGIIASFELHKTKVKGELRSSAVLSSCHILSSCPSRPNMAHFSIVPYFPWRLTPPDSAWLRLTPPDSAWLRLTRDFTLLRMASHGVALRQPGSFQVHWSCQSLWSCRPRCEMSRK